MKARIRLGIVVLLAAIAGWIAFRFVPAPMPELSRAEFLTEVRQGHIRKVAIEDQELIVGVSSTRGPFRTAFKKADDSRLASELRALGCEVVFETSGLGLI